MPQDVFSKLQKDGFYKGDNTLRTEIRELVSSYYKEKGIPIDRRTIRRKSEHAFSAVVNAVNNIDFRRCVEQHATAKKPRY